MSVATDLMMMYYAQNADPLPSAYRGVAYLEKPAGAVSYIDTGINISDNSYDMETVARHTVWGESGGYFGNKYVDEFTNIYRVIAQSTNNGYGWVTAGGRANFTTAQISLPINTWRHISMAYNKCVIDGVQVEFGRLANGSVNPNNLLLFMVNLVRKDMAVQMKFFILRRNGMFVRSYVPVVRIADSKPGMYDLCGSVCPLTNSSFYCNAGNGADFTWGELS